MFTTGALGPDEVEKTLSSNKLQESGTSLLYKKLLTVPRKEVLPRKLSRLFVLL